MDPLASRHGPPDFNFRQACAGTSGTRLGLTFQDASEVGQSTKCVGEAAPPLPVGPSLADLKKLLVGLVHRVALQMPKFDPD